MSTQNGRPVHYVKDFHTPTLVIDGEQDFRVPYTQGLQLFTALANAEGSVEAADFPG